MKHTLISKALILLLTLIIICMFFNMGCNVKRWDVTYVSRATGDGGGGAIVLYDIIKSSSQRDFYTQKISADGKALWGERGVLIGSGNRQSFFFELQIVSDGAAGAIISLAIYSPSKQRTYDYQPSSVDITRVGSEGKILWQKEITVGGTIMDDGNGGCIIADTRGDRLLFLRKCGKNTLRSLPQG
jgi:hypothetical protein